MLDLRLFAMPYTYHRIFCGAPAGLEEEQDAFYDAVADCTEHEAMPRGILLVPVGPTEWMRNLAAFQNAVDRNIKACTYYLQILGDGWGPPKRNFEHSFEVAKQCAADPKLPMREVALFRKESASGDFPGSAAGDMRVAEFSDTDSFRNQLRALLSEWLAALPGKPEST